MSDLDATRGALAEHRLRHHVRGYELEEMGPATKILVPADSDVMVVVTEHGYTCTTHGDRVVVVAPDRRKTRWTNGLVMYDRPSVNPEAASL